MAPIPVPILKVVGLNKTFSKGVKAVQNVSLSLDPGKTLGVVGESGCGKSTTAKLIMRTLPADSGSIEFDGREITSLNGHDLRRLRKRLQIVPQNPMTSLNPRLTVHQSIEFNLRAHGFPKRERKARVAELLDRVGLASTYATRYPHQISGGQSQRVAIARALATEPDLVICDEAVSALDKSVQAQVLNLLIELQKDLGVAYLFISHDLSVVEHIADDVAVMYLGRVVESGRTSRIWNDAKHPYTEALLSAAPGQERERIVLQGDPPNPANPASGCAFRNRCWRTTDTCSERPPELVTFGDGHSVACVHHAPLSLMVRASPRSGDARYTEEV